ncbi:MAG: GNAT family N-acetyltransferase [Anaerolineae bacterium CG_4_9_14_3_um_filter_57_17]|nr:GNAT family N-acetyltransferase [bacterium]NCT20814.1 GNAT family N-acetyltransferase [bacterium]PJB68671.1 MAG: GNAT family N-acetyltransferase [Anaerolineae bacterium CG_4_9_14_3_um_filter_57_17]
MITLLPIEQDDYTIFYEREIVDYAHAKVAAGNWPADEALAKSRAEFESDLPDGPRTKNQFIFTIFEDEMRQKMGVLWVEVKMDAPHHPAFIFDFVIEEPFRGQGHGKKALLALDEKLQGLGAESVGLHVFGHNKIAFELYKKMGYEVTNIQMRKMVGRAY